MKAVDTSTPKVYSRKDPDPNTKSTINKLQKEIRTKINQESTISLEKFCDSISLELDPKKSWHKITNFLTPKGPRSYD